MPYPYDETPHDEYIQSLGAGDMSTTPLPGPPTADWTGQSSAQPPPVEAVPEPIAPPPGLTPQSGELAQQYLAQPSMPRASLVSSRPLRELRSGNRAAAEQYFQAKQGLTEKSVKAAQTLAEQKAQASEKMATELAGQRQTLAEHNATVQEMAARQKEVEEAGMARFDEERRRVREMKIEPQRALGNVAGKVAAAIAMAAGAYSSAINGGPNHAANIINSAIDNDIMAQQDAIRNAKDDLGEQKGLLAEQMRVHGNERAAMAATKGILLEQAALRSKELLANTDSEVTRAEGAAITANLENQSLEQRYQVGQAYRSQEANVVAQEMALRNQNANRQTQAAIGGAKAQAEAIKAQMKEGTKNNEMFLPSGFEGDAPTKKAAEKLRDAYTTAHDARAAVQRIIDHRKKHGVEFADRKAVATGKALSKAAWVKLKESAKLGVLSESDMDILRDQITEDPSEVGYVLPQLESVLGDIDNGLNSVARANGVKLRGDWYVSPEAMATSKAKKSRGFESISPKSEPQSVPREALSNMTKATMVPAALAAPFTGGASLGLPAASAGLEEAIDAYQRGKKNGIF